MGSLQTECFSQLTSEPYSNDELVQALANGCPLINNQLNQTVLWFRGILLELQTDLWGEGSSDVEHFT